MPRCLQIPTDLREITVIERNDMKKGKIRPGKLRYGLFAAALVMSAGIFAMMTYAQKQILSEYEKKDIYVALSDIPRGVVLDESNISQYLVLKSVDAGCVSQNAVIMPGSLYGFSPAYDICEGTVLTDNMFVSFEECLTEMDDPVLAGFRTDDLSKAVSGVLRAGDRIDIYSSDGNGEGMLLCENVYVERGYDSSGSEVNDMSAAVMFNIFLDSSQVEIFYDGLRSGNMYVVKRC